MTIMTLFLRRLSAETFLLYTLKCYLDIDHFGLFVQQILVKKYSLGGLQR